MTLVRPIVPPARIAPSTLTRGAYAMTLSNAVERYLKDRRLGIADETERKYRQVLTQLVAYTITEQRDALIALTPDLVRGFLVHKARKGLTLKSLQLYRTAVAVFAEWAVEHRLLADSPMRGVTKIATPERLPRPFTPEERSALVALPLSPQDDLLRALLFYTGLRVTPLSTIRYKDCSWEPIVLGGHRFPGYIRTIGKRNVEHLAPLHPTVATKLQAARAALQHELGPAYGADAYVLAHATGRPYSTEHIERITREWGRAALVEKCVPHRFRHTYATMLLEADVPIQVVSKLLAHRSLATTMIYAKVADKAMAEAVLRLPEMR